MRRIGALVLAALLVGGCGADGGVASYEATDLRSDAAVSVEDLRGRPALLVSWATWCRECDEELAGLQAFATSPEADALQIVAVNLDAGDASGEIEAEVAEHGLTVELWRDRRNDFKATFGALGVPTTVLLDASGAVAGMFPGAVDFASAEVLDAITQLEG